MSCIRCGATEPLEEDHIIPKSKGGLDEASNKRWLCEGCHDYRHARDAILAEIKKNETAALGGYGNPYVYGMWIFRLGVLEAFNTPELVKERGYKSYWGCPQTHYSVWYPKILIGRGLKQMKMKESILVDSSQVILDSKESE